MFVLSTIAGDNWVVVCSDKHWRRDSKIRLKHVVTEQYELLTQFFYLCCVKSSFFLVVLASYAKWQRANYSDMSSNISATFT